MARNIPKALATFVSSDPEIARMYSNLQAAVQPLLDFRQQWFSTATAGTLNVLGNVAAKGAALLTSFRQVPDGTQSAPGLAFTTSGASGVWHSGGNTTSEQYSWILQNIRMFWLTTTCAFMQAPPNGAVVLFKSSDGNTLGSINGQGVVNMPSFVSAQGFKATYNFGQATTSSQAANSTLQTYEVTNTAAGSSAGSRYISFTMPVAGSVTHLTVDTSGTNVSMVVQLYKNGAIISGANTTLGPNTTKQVQPFAKGTYSFVSGDNLYCVITFQAAVSALVSVFPRVTIEFGA